MSHLNLQAELRLFQVETMLILRSQEFTLNIKQSESLSLPKESLSQEKDISSLAKVAVIGPQAATNLFGDGAFAPAW